MVIEKINTRPEEFKRFHELLTKNAPDGYEPFYFPLEKNGKDPWKGNSWKNNRKTYTEAFRLMNQGFNIGIAATEKDNLVIVDIDDLAQIKSHKPTLENQSRKRIGRHCFYFTDDPIAKSVFENSAKQNIATEDAGEVRSVWQYVVAAGSYVPVAPEELEMIPEDDRKNAGSYTLMVEHTVSDITYEELPEAYRVCLENKRAVDIANRQKKEKKPLSYDKENKNKSALWDLDIHDVTGKSDNATFRFPSPFHGSRTYKDTSVSNGLLHCWRHNCSHNALTYLAVECGISNCSGAGFGHNSAGGSDVNFDDPKTVFEIWSHAKNNGYIPNDDPMPTKAMVYYALNENLCKENDVIDGWKLPMAVYNKIIDTAPFNVGRDHLKKKSTKIGHALSEATMNPMSIAIFLQDNVPIWYDAAKNYWMWDDEIKRYDRVDETEIMCQISESMDLTIYKSQIKQEILEAIRVTGRQRRVKPTKISWIQFENMVVDIETGESFEATPDYFFASPVPHKLGDTEETPTINKLFKSWHSEKADHLCEICAYCLYDGYPIQRLFAFVGSGSNGKGQFMTLLRRLIGTENCTSTDLDKLAKSQFEPSKLYKKKAAFIGETDYSKLSRTNMLKALTGGDLVSCEFKGRDSFDFVNTAKIIISTNGLPATTDRSDGFYRRWNITEFKNKFKDGRDIVDEIPEREYENFCKKCVRLLREIINNGKLTYEDDQEKRREKYEMLSNPVQAFIENECRVGNDRYVPIWFLYEEYDKYRELRGYRKLTKKEFSTIVLSMDFEKGQKWYDSTSVKKYSSNESASDGKNWFSFFGLDFFSRPSRVTRADFYSFSYKENEVKSALEALEALENGKKQPLDDEKAFLGNSPVEMNPLRMLDTLILTEVRSLYPNLRVDDEYKFESDFCTKYPYFLGSMVRARLHALKIRGFHY